MNVPEHVVRGAHAADEVRLELGLGIEPITDLWKLIRELDIDLAFHGFGADGPDGVYFWDGRSGLIVVNADKRPLARQRFTVAHELGHHILHRQAGSPLVIGEGDLEAGGDKSVEEREADAFAGYLLAPTQAMRLSMGEKPASELSAEDIADLMHRFGTTFATTVYRLHNSGRITASDRDRLFANARGQVNWILQAKGYDREQLSPASLPPDHVLTALRMHTSGVIDLERLSQLLRVSEEDAAELAAGAARAQQSEERARKAFGEDLDQVLADADSD